MFQVCEKVVVIIKFDLILFELELVSEGFLVIEVFIVYICVLEDLYDLGYVVLLDFVNQIEKLIFEIVERVEVEIDLVKKEIV